MTATGRVTSRQEPKLTLALHGSSTPEFVLLASTVAVLVVLGLVMTFSASFVRAAADTGDAFSIFERQLLWCLLGLPPMIVAALLDYRWWRRLAKPFLIVALVAAAAVLVPGIGIMVNGARRWLELGPVRFQPAEMLKLAVPMYVAAVVAARWSQLRAGDLHALLMPAVPVIALASVLVIVEPDLETSLLIAVVGGLVLYAAGLPLRMAAGGLSLALIAGAISIAVTNFRRARFIAWLDPMAHAESYGYQTVQGLIALGNGGVFGVGLGQGRGKWLYIPNAHTDFVFAIIGEELGLLGATLVLGLFAAVAVAGIRAARRAPDPFGRLLAGGITAWLLLQAGMNMGSVVGVLPVTGVTLPLLSFGGSSLVFTMLALGLLMSVARAARPADVDSTPQRSRQRGGR